MSRSRQRRVSSSPAAYQTLEPRCVLTAVFPAYIDGSLSLGDASADQPYPLADTFNLSSNPDSTRTIYLDFDGHHSIGNSWDHDIVFPAYSEDGDATTFSDVELRIIQEVYQRVAEDFLPFHVNVTTIDPGEEALRVTDIGDVAFGTRVLLTQRTDGFDPNGGIAQLGSFTGFFDSPAFVFNKGAKDAAETVSHEVGHTLGLNHKGLGTEEYHPGIGTGNTSWAPIMGAGFVSSVTQWTDSIYANNTLVEDELNIITSGIGGLPYRADDFGDSLATATAIDLNDSIRDWGIIEQADDVDWFSFTADAGAFQLSVNPLEEGANLDVLATLYDASGQVVATDNLLDELYATFDLQLDAGTYYLSVDGTGRADYYSDYGSLGFYTIDATVTEPDAFDVVITDATFVATSETEFDYTFTLKNVGGLAIDLTELTSGPGSLTSELAVSTNATIGDQDDFVFGTQFLTAGVLAPGDDFTFTGSVTVNQNPSDFVYLGITADSTQVLDESDETNNLFVIQRVTSPTVVETIRDGGDISRPDLISTYEAVFSQDVQLTSDSLTVLNRTTNSSVVDVSAATFSYDASTLTATWDFSTLTQPLEAAFYRFVLDGASVTSVNGGVSLDGSNDGMSDGTAADNFTSDLYVALPGDTDSDGDVDVFSDGFKLLENLGTTTAATWADGDFNGDGAVDVFGDGFILLGNLGTDVNPLAASAPARSTPQPVSETELADNEPVERSANSNVAQVSKIGRDDRDEQATVGPAVALPAMASEVDTLSLAGHSELGDVSSRSRANDGTDAVFEQPHTDDSSCCDCPACLAAATLA